MTKVLGLSLVWNLPIIAARSVADTAPLIISLVMPCLLRYLDTTSIVCLYGTKIIVLCSVSSSTSCKAAKRGDISNSTTSFLSV